MRFAIATNDAYQSVLEALLSAGWQWEKLFISPGDWLHDDKQVIARALQAGVAVQHSPVTSADLDDLGAAGCEVLVVASYRWKIPAWDAKLRYAVNFHPSPLPEGRGPYPLVRAILEQRSSWAVSCHCISEAYDKGDILDVETFALDADECHESLRLKTQMAAKRLATRVATNLDDLWDAATPQGFGSYWPRCTDRERTIDFRQTVATIMRQIRAFGNLDCIATINDVSVFVHRAHGWLEPHDRHPGAMVHANGLSFVVAVADGYIAITEWSFNAPGAITSSLRP
jgi:methionyl-tRNA formyltransferase